MRTRHFGIVVTNMKKSLEFYENLLGFKIIKENDESGEYLDEMLSLKNVKVKTIKMSINKDSTLIELLQYSTPKSSLIEKRINDLGASHFSLTVKNLDEFYLNLKQEGIKFNSAPIIIPESKAKVVFCFDPDGTPIELVEEL